jgi:hypothetical protein
MGNNVEYLRRPVGDGHGYRVLAQGAVIIRLNLVTSARETDGSGGLSINRH